MTLAWKLEVSLSAVLARSWTFLPNIESFAVIGGDADVTRDPQYAPGPFTIKKPSTLILENVTLQYSGIYRFGIYAGGKSTESDVTVTVAGKCLLDKILYLFTVPFTTRFCTCSIAVIFRH